MIVSFLKVKGHSMEPVIKQGSTVLISKIPYFFASPKKGDVIVFKKNGELFVKRIRTIQGDKINVMGDNRNDSFDSRKFGIIAKKDIVGKVIKHFT